MKTFVALTLLVTFGLMAEARSFPELLKKSEQYPVATDYVRNINSRITGGQPASRGQFPWQVAVVFDGGWFCGGCLISNEWILTAKHCLGSTFQITLGSNKLYQLDEGGVIVYSTTSIAHDTDDIGLIKVNVTYSDYISPIRLPSRSDQDKTFVGETVRASGWGKTSDNATGITDTLQFVDLTVIAYEDCSKVYCCVTTDMICYRTPGGKNTCSGDSGGSIVYLKDDGYILVGVTTFGAAAGCEYELPGGGSRVTSFLDWIQEHTGIVIS
ncbi:brachyurin-like isoform X4 [Periplaneta americana]|uniref:brachyurin-like isoform X4 n=1 Tax=Periplaneta americana TaxID=6978 RepID=UPI0037E7AAF8